MLNVMLLIQGMDAYAHQVHYVSGILPETPMTDDIGAFKVYRLNQFGCRAATLSHDHVTSYALTIYNTFFAYAEALYEQELSPLLSSPSLTKCYHHLHVSKGIPLWLEGCNTHTTGSQSLLQECPPTSDPAAWFFGTK